MRLVVDHRQFSDGRALDQGFVAVESSGILLEDHHRKPLLQDLALLRVIRADISRHLVSSLSNIASLFLLIYYISAELLGKW